VLYAEVMPRSITVLPPFPLASGASASRLIAVWPVDVVNIIENATIDSWRLRFLEGAAV